MPKKVVLELILVEESNEKTNRQILEDILAELQDFSWFIPWCDKIERVTVKDC